MYGSRHPHSLPYVLPTHEANAISGGAVTLPLRAYQNYLSIALSSRHLARVSRVSMTTAHQNQILKSLEFAEPDLPKSVVLRQEVVSQHVGVEQVSNASRLSNPSQSIH